MASPATRLAYSFAFMKSVFNNTDRQSLITRISLLNKDCPRQWGKMDLYQMLKHCTLSEEMFLGEKTYKRLLIGRIFGKMALNAILKNSDPIKPNQPTHPELKITGDGNIETEKMRWITLLEKYDRYNVTVFVHPFFGRMSKEQVGRYVYKHTDHHLRQFNT